jgi:hypothetical protein
MEAMVSNGDGGISRTHSDYSAIDTRDSKACGQRQEMVRTMHLRSDDKSERYEKIVSVVLVQ